MKFFSSRLLNLSGFVICILLLAAAYYMQYVQNIQPCPLCMLQRLTFIVLAVILLLAVLHNPREIGVRVYGVMTFIVALLGVLLAWRHIWLQQNPSAATDICMPGYSYIMTHLPFTQAVHFLLQSSENCSHIIHVWGVSVPVWTLFGFAVFCIFALAQIIFAKRLGAL